MKNKWYGGIVGADDCAYGIPSYLLDLKLFDCFDDKEDVFFFTDQSAIN
jgi:hypothetical protein